MPQLQKIVCYGDSITAGYGLPGSDAYPAALEKLLRSRGWNVSVSNQGLSGATTKDALAGVQNIIRMKPSVVVVEFGGNDGLRGLRLENTKQYLDAMLSALDAARIRTVLAGITLPPEYGREYISRFEKMYRDLAAKHHAVLIPMIYSGFAGKPGMLQADGIHPTAEGSRIVAKTVAQALEPLLARKQ